jgi:hypothetical protein
MRFLLFFAGLFLISLMSCKDQLDDSPCGDTKTGGIYRQWNKLFDTTGGDFNTYMDNGNRVFQWATVVEEACTDEHVKTDFLVFLLDEKYKDSLSARGGVNWQFLYEDTVPLTLNDSDLEGKLETGLKQAFPSLQGWFIPSIEIYFPTKGSFTADTTYLKNKIDFIQIISVYRHYKE